MLRSILLLLILSTNSLFSQLQGQAKIDSLEAELPKAKADTNAVNLLADLSYEYYSINPNKGIEYGEMGLEISEEIGWKRGEAGCSNSLGINNAVKSDYPKALKYFQKVLKIYEEQQNIKGISGALNNIGLIYNRQSNFSKALEYYFKALKINEEFGFKISASNNLANIGSIYVEQNNFTKAIEYFFKSLKIDEELNNKNGIASDYSNIGNVYNYKSDYPKALEYYNNALNIYEEMQKKSGIALILGNIGNIYENQSDYPKALEYYNKAIKIDKELNNRVNVARHISNMGYLYYNLSQESVLSKISESNQLVSLKKEINLKNSIDYLVQSIELFEEIGELKRRSEVNKILSDAYKQKGNYKKAYEAHVEFKKLQDSVFNMDKSKKIATLTATREKEVAEKELEIQKLENIRRRNESYALYGGLALFAVVLFVIYRQRKQSEKLLLNILPAAIAKRLKAKEHPIADHFENASVVFIDIVGFTKISSDVKAERIVEVLNIIFTKFDEIAAKFKLEKIKTIGDSYMAVTGVPLPDPEHAKNMAKFALEVKTEMHNYKTEDDTLIQFRIGIDCGDVVAGVIGSNKFIYDLWGDTVNTASRMESNGTPDEIHVTERFRDKLSDSFHFEERGEMDIKGKGIMKTYYLTGEKNA